MWKIAKMSELSYQEIHALYKLRTDIFVVEQQCAYPEVDDEDLTCWHGLYFDEENRLAGYFRIIEEPEQTRLGRIIVAPFARGTQLGREVVMTAINNAPINKNIYIDAQLYLIDFYRSFGFEAVTEPFSEDGIMHIGMKISRY